MVVQTGLEGPAEPGEEALARRQRQFPIGLPPVGGQAVVCDLFCVGDTQNGPRPGAVPLVEVAGVEPASKKRGMERR